MKPDSAEFRRLLLRVMLGSLALAALGGVLTVLFSGHETAWRVVSTTAVTAIAAGLLMATSRLSERPRTRAAGFLGMAVVVGEWILVQILIWGLYRSFGAGHQLEERLGMTLFFGNLTVALAMLALILRGRPNCRVTANASLALAAVVGLLWILGVWWPGPANYFVYRSSAGRLVESAGATFVMGLPIIFLLLGFAARRWWVWLTLMCNAMTLALWLIAIWLIESPHSNGTVECLATVAVLGAFCNVIRLVRLPDSQRWVGQATMAAAALTAILLDTVIILEKQGPADTDLLARLAAAAAIITGCGTLSLFILARLNWHDVRPTDMPVVTELLAVCPICRKRQTLKLGESRCVGCGLGFDIKLKEPRCPQCNYLLLMLHSERCPECGTPVQSSTPDPFILPS